MRFRHDDIGEKLRLFAAWQLVFGLLCDSPHSLCLRAESGVRSQNNYAAVKANAAYILGQKSTLSCHRYDSSGSVSNRPRRRSKARSRRTGSAQRRRQVGQSVT